MDIAIRSRSMDLPSPIRAYFEADSADRCAVEQMFAPDSVVVDEGKTHVGRAAIETWRRRTRAAFDYVVEPFDVLRNDEGVEVRATVTGTFPGSPLTLRYAFRLERDQIAALEITL